jgi:hypothetical protein
MCSRRTVGKTHEYARPLLYVVRRFKQIHLFVCFSNDFFGLTVPGRLSDCPALIIDQSIQESLRSSKYVEESQPQKGYPRRLVLDRQRVAATALA